MKPFNDISSVITELQNALACASRIFALLEETPESPDPSETITDVKGKIDIDHVCFRYVPDKKLIENFNLQANPGKRIAIVGPTGCGKTTFINLLMRFYDINSGTISIDGHPIDQISRHSLRNSYGMVLQDTWIKNGTVRDNINIGNPEATDEEIIEAAKMSHSWEFIRRLPDGLELESEDEEAWMGTYNLLTWKPVIYAANVSEDDLADDGDSNAYVQEVKKYAAEQKSEVFVICAEIEEEISELDDDEKKMFLEDLGLKESGLEKLVKASYSLLGLMSFLTSGEDETRAWTIKIGTKAPQAAGKIHTDFERGFIKAEVVNYQDLLDCGSYAGAREKGLVRMEGKEYVVQDGDVILFRFNV